ncbi:transcriptional regulator [Pigmentiphaga aceris]|uniref:Transcriptional regulator n=1 Tax=Pigmentiphaga aceris TaxID=1940612 RepID=A0A5C0AT36_9BURK|nr:PhaM family polyhydroxyalkanoate granule multifunctional regulatory protein [Pigmentiphaga aceris]QEI04804.1 transcriptional regulator [Pigmentiphaga aceris]
MSQATNPFGIPGIPGLDTSAGAPNPVMQGLDMLNKVWTNLGTMGTSAPAFGPGFKPEDLDRRITDLKAVENWLRVNQALLQSTIQGLEVQRATFATLQSFVTPPADAAKATGDAAAPMQAWWNMVQDQFSAIAKAAATPPASPAAAASRAKAASAPDAPKPARKTAAKKTPSTGGR